MKNTYNGAVMALPERDEELFERINTVTSQRRLAQEAEAKRMYLYADQESEEELPRVNVGRIAGTVLRLLMAAAFGGAVARGWCVPEFGAVGAVTCGLWAVAAWRR